MIRPRASNEPLDQATFDTIADLAYRESGLTLVLEKAPMVQSRLRPRLQALGFSTFNEYSSFLTSESGNAERRRLISALTTNVSHFFREEHHFDALVALVRARLPALRAGAPLRIWSAGCSQGQEPLSVAMTLMEHFPDVVGFDLRILATDIDPEVLTFAQRGWYPQRMLARLPDDLRHRYFEKVEHPTLQAEFAADPALLGMIRYKELNLLGTWPLKTRFDAIFCRNTVIYFDAKTQQSLWPRFYEHLHPHGRLFLGHSERINGPGTYGFDCTGPTTYQPVTT